MFVPDDLSEPPNRTWPHTQAMAHRHGMKERLKAYLYRTIIQLNYFLNNYKEVVWLIGDGRSGTTWVANLLNHKKNYREMFEPFHPKTVDSMSFLKPHLYMRPQDSHSKLENAAKEIFCGKFIHPSVDPAVRSLTFSGLLIKDIFANLFSYWASRFFPDLKIILLIRNPFSVALSKYNRQNWFWMTDPSEFLKQPKLCEDYLSPFDDIIQKTSREADYITCQILIWSIINYVPLMQFSPNQIHVAFYEKIYANPNDEVSGIIAHTKVKGHPVRLSKDIINQPSRVTNPDSGIIKGFSPITSWKSELSVRKIDAGLKILQCFGFEKLYDENSMPNRAVIDKMLAK